jgi:alpha-methylacyl-CoA racemase
MKFEPLKNLRVVEFAGLAPAPLCGQMLADYGATVIRIDKASDAREGILSQDSLTRGKKSIALDLQAKNAVDIARQLIAKSDVLLDPYRPGVLEKLGLGPEVFLDDQNGLNKKLVFARLTGYGQHTTKSSWAGHDINYLAEAGLLSMSGPADGPPAFTSNVLGDFASLALPAFAGILLALYSKTGQVLDVNIVDSARYLALFVSLNKYLPDGGSYLWENPRGQNILDGGAPFYRVYETKDSNEFVSVGCLEERFYQSFLQLLDLQDDSSASTTHDNTVPSRMNPENWKTLSEVFSKKFKGHGIAYWKTRIEMFPNACCSVLNPIAHPNQIPDAIVRTSVETRSNQPSSWFTEKLCPGEHTKEIVEEILGPKTWMAVRHKPYIQEWNKTKSLL